MTNDVMADAVENAPARFSDDPDRFDDHLKSFGIHEAGLRAWIVGRVARHLTDVVGFDPGESLWHWRPGSGSYVALGTWQEFEAAEWQIANGWIRFAAVRKTSLELARRSAELAAFGESMIVDFPDGFRGSASSWRARPPRPRATCPTCFTQLPATGICDDCV